MINRVSIWKTATTQLNHFVPPPLGLIQTLGDDLGCKITFKKTKQVDQQDAKLHSAMVQTWRVGPGETWGCHWVRGWRKWWTACISLPLLSCIAPSAPILSSYWMGLQPCNAVVLGQAVHPISLIFSLASWQMAVFIFPFKRLPFTGGILLQFVVNCIAVLCVMCLDNTILLRMTGIKICSVGYCSELKCREIRQ